MNNSIDINNLTDEELVKLSLKQDLAYAVLIKRYENKLSNYIRRIVNLSKEDVEDVVQEVFLSVYKNLNAFNPLYKFSTWIYRIAHNSSITYIRKVKYRPLTLDLSDPELSERLSTNLDLEDRLSSEIIFEHIQSELGQLDLRYKSPLILKFIEDKSYDEISDILKIPKGTVGTLINRGKKLLEKRLKKYLSN